MHHEVKLESVMECYMRVGDVDSAEEISVTAFED